MSLIALSACTSRAPQSARGTGSTVARDAAATAGSGSGPLVALEEDARWSRLAVPIGVGLDGRRWIGAVEHDLVVYDGDREVSRFPVMATYGDVLAALPDGGWVAGARVLGPDGTIRFDGHDWCNRLGRFASCKAKAFSADGAVAIIAGSDSPSTCLRDRACGSSGSWRGALVRLTFGPAGEGDPTERRLIEHEERRDFEVAASARWVAATDGRELWVWPATGDGAPVTASIDGAPLSDLAWAGDRYLVGTRFVDAEHSEIVVLDGDVGYARSASWIVEGTIEAFAVRPGGVELAIGTSWYRARAQVEVDEKRVEVYGLDGARHARVDVAGAPMSLAWSPRGDALFAAITGSGPESQMVIRYIARH